MTISKILFIFVEKLSMAKSKLKQNVLLAKTEALGTAYKNAIADLSKFFRNSQGSFRGIQKFYATNEDKEDLPNLRGVTRVVTTVGEKLDYFVGTNAEYINSLFSQEATNASGKSKAELVVNGDSWGEFSSLELLRLKSLLENQSLKQMYGNVPVRPDSQEWQPSVNEMYSGREDIFEGPKNEYIKTTTVKEEYILEDPNVSKIEGRIDYSAKTSIRNIVEVLGKGSTQNFSGEWSHRQRAVVQRNINTLWVAVIEALKRANEVEIVESKITADKIFGFIHSTEE